MALPSRFPTHFLFLLQFPMDQTGRKSKMKSIEIVADNHRKTDTIAIAGRQVIGMVKKNRKIGIHDTIK